MGGALGTGQVAVNAANVYAAVSYTAGLPYAHVPYVTYGKREAEPYTIGQVNAGVPVANAAAEGRLHNVGVITNAAVVAGYPHTVATYAHHPGALVYNLGRKKREAEAQYGVFPYHSLATVGVAATSLGHAVAVTPFGATHSSNVGVCVNYLGARVAC